MIQDLYYTLYTYYEFHLQEHGVESGPAKNQNRIEHSDPPRADLSQPVAPSHQQQNNCTNSQPKFENYHHIAFMYDRTRERIQFPQTSHAAGAERASQIVQIQYGDQND